MATVNEIFSHEEIELIKDALRHLIADSKFQLKRLKQVDTDGVFKGLTEYYKKRKEMSSALLQKICSYKWK